jgi:hypothetical protein
VFSKDAKNFVSGRKIEMKAAKVEPETQKQKFEKFARALMAVPKKELDKELDKHERKKTVKTSKHRS